METANIGTRIVSMAQRARLASRVLRSMSAGQKNTLLLETAAALLARQETIQRENSLDMAAAKERGMTSAMLNRLHLSDAVIQEMVNGLREVAALTDPVGEIEELRRRPSGILVGRMRIPLGVICMIYESRPNVTIDAAALCLKSGNAVILRGGSEAIHSNTAIAAALRRAIGNAGLDPAVLTLVTDLRREAMLELLQLTDIVDLAIPRGGEGLIRFVAEHARVPVIKHYKGVCHLYVDRAADLELALRLLLDGKASRPGVCNALETLLVHAEVAADFLPRAAQALRARGVEIRGDAATCARVPDAIPASEDDYAAEFLDLVIAVRVVESLDQAIAHIRRHTSDHTEVIVTGDPATADRFVRSIRSSAVMVNASSRFNDGGELGLGAEIGISTTRLHSYGPMGLEALTVERFVVRGQGQVRHPDLL